MKAYNLNKLQNIPFIMVDTNTLSQNRTMANDELIDVLGKQSCKAVIILDAPQRICFSKSG